MLSTRKLEKMKFILMAFVTAGFIGSNTLALADSPVSAGEAAKIKTAIEVLGCRRQDGKRDRG